MSTATLTRRRSALAEEDRLSNPRTGWHMQKSAAQKLRDTLMDLATKHKLLVQAGFPFVTRDYRMGLPGGTLELLPDPTVIPREKWVSTEFEVVFFPEIGAPVKVADWDEERWTGYLRGRIDELKERKA